MTGAKGAAEGKLAWSRLESFVEKCWLPGRDKLAVRVPSLNTPAGRIGWLVYLYLSPWVSLSAVYLIERNHAHRYLYIQAVLVGGTFVMVDVAGMWCRGLLKRIFGERAYAFAFGWLFMPGLMMGFMPGLMHIGIVPAGRILPWSVSAVLAAPVFALSVLMAIKFYLGFGLDRLFYMYVYFPGEGEMTDAGVFEYIRHPQYSSLFLFGLSLALFNLSEESLLLYSFILLYGVCRMIPEERELVRRYGDSYIRYRAEIPALLPRKEKLWSFCKYLLQPKV